MPDRALDEQLSFPLYAASRAVTRIYARLLEPVGLTYAQYLAMLVIWEAGETTVKGLGTRLHLDSGTLTPLLKRLEQRGIVERERDPDDERRVIVRSTPAGRMLQTEVVSVPDAVREATGMTSEEVDELKARLGSLLANLNDYDVAASPAASSGSTA